MFKQTIVILIALSVVTPILHVTEQQQQAADKMASVQSMSYDDYYRLHILFVTAAKRGALSDHDLDWLISLARMPVESQNDFDLVQSQVMSVFKKLDHITAPQKDQIIMATQPFLAAQDPNDMNTGLLKQCAADTQGLMGDKRSVKYLIPLLTDSRQCVVRHAEKALQRLGYKSTIKNNLY